MKDHSVQILSDLTIHAKYAKYVPELKRRETWAEICERNMLMHIRKYPQLSGEIQQVYREFVIPKKVLPSMRAMQFGGRPIELSPNRIFNCFSADTPFLTDNGVKTFAETAGTEVNVLTREGKFRPARVEAFGTQPLNRVVMAPYGRTNLLHIVDVTPDHRWVLEDGSVTTALKVGDRVPTNSVSQTPSTRAYVDGFAHGVIFGDGTAVRRHPGRFMVRLCGRKTSLLTRLQNSSYYRTECRPPSSQGEPHVTLVSADIDLKSLPSQGHHDYLHGFIDGWLACDSSKKNRTDSLCLDTQDRVAADWIVQNAPFAGYVVTGWSRNDKPTNYGARKAPLNRISLRREAGSLFVKSVEPLGRSETVYCVVEPVTKTFTLASGILTGNCAYAPVDDPAIFSEAMFLLLGGTGLGYSVQRRHVSRLPWLIGPGKTLTPRRFVVGDSIEGWADAVKVLVEAYFYGKRDVVFDFSDIRPKGATLVTSGGKAPGPAPLKRCIEALRDLMDNVIRERGPGPLEPIEAHDMMCHIADAVLAGGIRRAALICLFDRFDDVMLTCKSGEWWVRNPQRGRANNSAVLPRNEVTQAEFEALWADIRASGSGEPGVYWTNDPDLGTNPCGEISLRPFQFCNLTEIDVSDVTTQEDLNSRAVSGAFIGTMQAGYTDFHYLRPIWRETTEEDALIGVGMTGIASGAVLDLSLEEAAYVAKLANQETASEIGIKPAARVTTVKPAGTSSLVLGSSSGIHAWHGEYYIRRMRLGKNEAVYRYLSDNHPQLVKDEHFRPTEQAVVEVPQRAPEGAILRTESPLELLERVRRFNLEWIRSGHRDGANYNNVSCTISVKDDEWGAVGSWMWEHRQCYNGISVLPYDGGTYIQAPFEDIDEATYHRMLESLTGIDLTKVIEIEDNTDLTGEVACGAGGCELK